LFAHRAEWLDKKNTIFGRVGGDTIYNLIKLNDYEVRHQGPP
jgi:peptidyl-prolyl cis-trans isomerase SDCCAG10